MCMYHNNNISIIPCRASEIQSMTKFNGKIHDKLRHHVSCQLFLIDALEFEKCNAAGTCSQAYDNNVQRMGLCR